MMNVKREHLDAERLGGHQRRMEQRRRVAAAAPGDGDAAIFHRRRGPQAQRSLLSVKRP
ncbi:hypothetical protein [Rhizobacter sp. AJA081-3]|uniref:hypothetical protein n=1 Tax=Rhizobacter sp. AJA081-3 TaxID=2753607 RepID=UPI001FD79FF4|nr:hypothetical protein [Rhizobacter sp. AJA081-3]